MIWWSLVLACHGGPDTVCPEGAVEPAEPTVTPPAPTGDTAAAPPAVESRCTVTDTRASCTRCETTLLGRGVYYQVPAGPAPPEGWPVVVFYQGSFVQGRKAFEADVDAPFGQYALTRTVAALLDSGYAVVAPETLGDGRTAWQTNVPPFNLLWTTSADHRLVEALLDHLGTGEMGDLDLDRLYAMGISSGGFMTSRMAVSYPGVFRALVVHSASYATCGVVCVVPALPADHPPTRFLHGDDDVVVRAGDMERYLAVLLDDGIEADALVDPDAGHVWLDDGPEQVVDWFDRH